MQVATPRWGTAVRVIDEPVNLITVSSRSSWRNDGRTFSVLLNAAGQIRKALSRPLPRPLSCERKGATVTRAARDGTSGCWPAVGRETGARPPGSTLRSSCARACFSG
ncbi:hypothetical protein SKAU_G00044070 [Synaphobranchus kaupii]|uniref:Uncharacterized protein n=1 Tax=Synaphobranchus kaupii TaxID=118154 RepID=A0A9Q1G2N2_SYNKA|nr:hypothetical protein SKAU_G00044070 [Synaphobranchus kaupii]